MDFSEEKIEKLIETVGECINQAGGPYGDYEVPSGPFCDMWEAWAAITGEPGPEPEPQDK